MIIGNRTMVGLIKDRYRVEPWIVRHGWPIELMSQFAEYPHPETSAWTGHRLSLIADCSDGPIVPKSATIVSAANVSVKL